MQSVYIIPKQSRFQLMELSELEQGRVNEFTHGSTWQDWIGDPLVLGWDSDYRGTHRPTAD